MNKEIRNMILKDTLEELKRVKEFYKKLNVYTDYDNYFLPVDNMEEAKRYYEEILGLKRNLISLIREWLLIILEMKNLQ